MHNNVFIAFIDSYDATSGHYYVRAPEYSIYSPPVPAYILSPTPGGGMKGAPAYARDTEVLVALTGGTYYIIGFPAHKGPILHNSHMPMRPTGDGETVMSDSFGSTFGFNAEGSFFVFLTSYAQMVLNAVQRKLTATLSNLRLNFPAGSLEYEYDGQKKTSQGRLLIYKTLEGTMPGAPPEDKMQIKVGKLESGAHMIEGTIKQEFAVTKQPAFKIAFKIGKQDDGKWFDVATQVGALPASAINYSVIADDKGLLDLTIKKGATPDSQADVKVNAEGIIELKVTKGTSKEITMKLDAATGIQIFVNKDKAKILVDGEGNIALIQDPGAKLYLGGKEKGQQLVTKSWVDLVFANHMHPTAGLGPPSPPIPLPPPPVVADSKTNAFTFTTLGE